MVRGTSVAIVVKLTPVGSKEMLRNVVAPGEPVSQAY